MQIRNGNSLKRHFTEQQSEANNHILSHNISKDKVEKSEHSSQNNLHRRITNTASYTESRSLFFFQINYQGGTLVY